MEPRSFATLAVQKAIRSGALTRQPCCVCGEAQVVAHHEDYSRPNYITFLCRKHHGLRHSELGWGTAKKSHSRGSLGIERTAFTSQLKPSIHRKLISWSKINRKTVYSSLEEAIMLLINQPKPSAIAYIDAVNQKKNKASK